MTNEMKEITFKKINDETWRDTAVKSLRGMPYEKLLTTTVEGIQLNPIYTKESYHQHFGEQAIPFVQKVREGMQTSHWTIAQQPYATDSTAFMEQVKESLDKGNEAIVYAIDFVT